MSEHVSYRGKYLGKFHVDNNSKVFFVAENLESLTALFSIKPEDTIKMEDRGEISFETFRKDYLSKVSAFYPTDDEYILRGHSGRTIEQFEKLHKE